MNDKQVIERVLDGDNGAFEMLILKYQSQIFYTALNIVKNKLEYWKKRKLWLYSN